jgi:hypothetical protein
MIKRQRHLVLIAILILLIIPSNIRSEVLLSVFAGPSTSLRQDLKYKKYNQQGEMIDKQTVASDTYLRFKIGAKVAYFFNKKLGMEAEYFLGQNLSGIDTTDDGHIDTISKQNRHAFFLSFVYRQAMEKLMRPTFYGGMGTGMVYSDFEGINNSWDYGGQFFTGINFPLNPRRILFLELKYFWAADVVDTATSPGRHYKTSGNNTANFANHIFGPHYDTQIIALMVGMRFKLKD